MSHTKSNLVTKDNVAQHEQSVLHLTLRNQLNKQIYIFASTAFYSYLKNN